MEINNNYGGDISNISGLKHILSIGYEVECGILMKLTRSEVDGSDKIILFNSDTARKDILEFKKFEENPQDIDEDIIERLEEMVEDKMYDDNGKVDKNSVFHITNDIAMSPFIKKLDTVCHYPSDEKIKTHSFTEDNVDHTEEKNELYIFRDTKGKEYKIHFLFSDKTTNCSTHSNVEWVFTYYKPQRSKNIIIDTFTNMIKNLVRHLSDLKPINGNFIMKYMDGNDEQKELIIAKPEKRVLYHKPDTNLYYLLTQFYDKPFTIDDACSVFQMTFSSKGENIMKVMIALLTETLNSIPVFTTYITVKLDILLSIQKCVDELVDNYNKTATKHKLVPNRQQNKIRIDIIKNYLCLILLKINCFFDFKNADKPVKYLKNLLFFNCRHSNYVLYVALKRKIEKMFDVKSAVAIGIIKKIVFQPEFLKQIISPHVKLRKGALSLSNTLDKSNKNYGDPIYSLVSYFDFFEEPVDNESNRSVNSGKILNYDWLEYKSIDDYSAKMDLKNDIALVECRIFQKLLSSYVYSIADAELKEQMTNGPCNILTKRFSPDVSSLSIANLKKIIEIQDGLNTKKNEEKKITQNLEKTCPNDKILNPKTNRCIRVCYVGETRNNKNRCVKKSKSKTKKLKLKMKRK
jgi:hypothetical protein